MKNRSDVSHERHPAQKIEAGRFRDGAKSLLGPADPFGKGYVKPKVRRVDGVRVLSVQQPWAWAIVEGHKLVENRTWNTRYRGPVLIHAGVTVRGPEIEYLRKEFRLKPPSRSEIDRGCIVGVAELVDVVTRKNAKRYGRWFGGPYGLVLRNAVALRKPVKVKSQLGLYRPTPALLVRVNRQLPARRRIRAGER